MIASLRRLNIDKISLKVLLGRDCAYQKESLNILSILIKFVTSTNRLDDI